MQGFGTNTLGLSPACFLYGHVNIRQQKWWFTDMQTFCKLHSKDRHDKHAKPLVRLCLGDSTTLPCNRSRCKRHAKQQVWRNWHLPSYFFCFVVRYNCSTFRDKQIICVAKEGEMWSVLWTTRGTETWGAQLLLWKHDMFSLIMLPKVSDTKVRHKSNCFAFGILWATCQFLSTRATWPGMRWGIEGSVWGQAPGALQSFAWFHSSLKVRIFPVQNLIREATHFFSNSVMLGKCLNMCDITRRAYGSKQTGGSLR